MTAISAIIPASGLGKRLGSGSDKAFVRVAGVPLIACTLSVFQECSEIDEIVLVIRKPHIDAARELVRDRGFTKVAAVVEGGEHRQDSVKSGLAAVSPGSGIVVIHDGARPFVTADVILSSIEAARSGGAAIATVPVVDTIKTSPDGSSVGATLERGEMFTVQTPQTFRRDIIESAYRRAYEDGFYGTDDASLVERLGVPVGMVGGSYENIKITTPADMNFAEAIMQQRGTGMPRVGHGYDIHRFAEGRKLFLGGVEFPGEQGLLGHSDADVMLHAVADALLGAANAGDIGRLFPDTDPAYKDIRSTLLLERAAELVRGQGWAIGNVDVTLIAERPKIAGRASEMSANIAAALKIDAGQVSVKASTSEKLGPIGEGLGIECFAVALLYPSKPPR